MGQQKPDVMAQKKRKPEFVPAVAGGQHEVKTILHSDRLACLPTGPPASQSGFIACGYGASKSLLSSTGFIPTGLHDWPITLFLF